MTKTLTFTGTVVLTSCWCGIQHGIPQDLYNHVLRQRNNGERQQDIYCPLGHAWTFAGQGTAERLRLENERLERVIESRRRSIEVLRQERDHEKRKVAAAKGRITKLKKRIAKGVCPCCNRYFPALHRHVAQEHPEYVLPEGVTLDGDT